MAKTGQILKQARLARGIGLERVAEDTNIGIRYLSGLEEDDLSFFPGEPYVVGFMRNYAEYLGLDGPSILAEYRRPAPETAPETAIPAEPVSGNLTQPPQSLSAEPQGLEQPQGHELPQEPFSPPAPESPETKPKPKRRRHSLDPNDPLDAILAAGPPQTIQSPYGHSTYPGAPQAGTADTREAVRVADADRSTRSTVEPVPGKNRVIPVLAGVLVIVALGVLGYFALKSAGGSTPGDDVAIPGISQSAGSRVPVEHRVESMPFETRLYPEDSLIVGFAQDLYKIRLTVIDDAIAFETPFGPVKVGLGKEAAFDPDKDGQPDFALLAAEFARNEPGTGALVRVESRSSGPAKAAESSGTDVKVPAGEPVAGQNPGPELLLRSARGPFPFVVTVTFRGPCMFRYESDRREWVEKYYSKGESITINATNTLQLWASNARAARAALQAPGGKTVDFELGGAGEIAVKRLSWSQGGGSWVLSAVEAD